MTQYRYIIEPITEPEMIARYGEWCVTDLRKEGQTAQHGTREHCEAWLAAREAEMEEEEAS